jgi:hypothetical protein
MLLTQDRLERAVALLTQRAGEREGRRVPRVPVRGTVPAVLEPDSRPELVTLRDISRRGLGITHRGALPEGRQVLVGLPASPARTEWLRCVVGHCARLTPDTFLVGPEFVDEPSAVAGA